MWEKGIIDNVWNVYNEFDERNSWNIQYVKNTRISTKITQQSSCNPIDLDSGCILMAVIDGIVNRRGRRRYRMGTIGKRKKGLGRNRDSEEGCHVKNCSTPELSLLPLFGISVWYVISYFINILNTNLQHDRNRLYWS